MSWTTSSRILFEQLSHRVFEIYFGILDFGVILKFLNTEFGFLFFIGTFIVYAASTYNNFVIRYQFVSSIDFTFGYQFFYPYVALIERVAGGSLDTISSWRSISSHNNLVLSNVSDSATQWPTIFGDFVWDFGLIGSAIMVFIVSTLFGYILGRGKYSVSVFVKIFALYLVSFLIMPLINPFASIQFHTTLIIISMLMFLYRLKLKL
jgi:hypothetical protein